MITAVAVSAVIGSALPTSAAITFRNQTTGWAGPGSNPSNVWTAQLDLDPQLEIILVDGNPSAYVYILDGLSLALEAESPPSGHGMADGVASLLVDIDDDGQVELLVGFGEGSYSHTVIFDTDIAVGVSGGELPHISVAPALAQNHPNPLTSSTTIHYEIARPQPVTLRILDVQGRVVRTLVDGRLVEAGPHDVLWDGSNDKGNRVASGQYYYQLVTQGGASAKKLILLR
jgi:hypothetical protein